MERFELKVYDDVKDRSPLYCGGGAVLVGVMAWREYSTTGEPGLRFCLMLLVMAGFAVVAVLLVRRHQMKVEVIDGKEADAHLTIFGRGASPQVILKADFAYVKLEQNQVVIHFYKGDDLMRASFSIKGAAKGRVEALVDILGTWQR